MNVSGQVLVRDLATALDGHGGINNIEYEPPVSPSLDGTLTVTTADGTEFNFAVANGRGISNITWTTSGTPGDGMIHTGTIEYNDGTTSTVQFQDGIQGLQGVQTYVWIKWSQTMPSADTDMQNDPAAFIGIYSGTNSSAPSDYTAYSWYEYKGNRGEKGDYIEPAVTYGNSTSAGLEPSTWYNSPTSISYSAGQFIWKRTQYVLHEAQTVQATVTEIIGYIGQNGSGSGSVNQITFNGVVFQDDGTGNVEMTVDADNVGGIANPENKANGQVLTYDSAADEWVAATPSTGSITTVNNVGPTAGTTNVQLYATVIPMSSSDSTNVADAMPTPSNAAPTSLGTASPGTSADYSRADHRHPMPSASDVGAVSTEDVKYKIYNSVTDIGLTSGSATIAGAFSAMPNYSILIAPRSEFATAEQPVNASGDIEIRKVGENGNLGGIWFHGREDTTGDYRMFLNSSGVPTGAWVRVIIPSSGLFLIRSATTQSVSINANSNAWVGVTPPTVAGYKAVAIAGWQARASNVSLSVYSVRFDTTGKVNVALHNLSTSAQATGCYAEVDVLYMPE